MGPAVTASCPKSWGRCRDSLVVQAERVPAAALHREANTPQEGLGVSGHPGLAPLLFGTCCRLSGVWVPLLSLVLIAGWCLEAAQWLSASRPTPWGPPHESNQGC